MQLYADTLDLTRLLILDVNELSNEYLITSHIFRECDYFSVP